MKTLVDNATNNYLKTGIVPRLFVKIEEANLFLGTKAYTETAGDEKPYTNALKSTGSISQAIKPFGGIAEVSGVEIANLELGENVNFCTETDLSPFGTVHEPMGAGRSIKAGSIGHSYSTVRGSSWAVFSNAAITCGQRNYTLSGERYTTYRAAMQFSIPAMTSCEDAVIALYGNTDKSDTDFEVYIIEGTWTTWAGTSVYSSFTGHASGDTAYSDDESTGSPPLNETWRSNSFSTSTTTPNYIRLNEIGRDLVVSNAGSTLKLLFLSKRDFDGTDTNKPTGDEFIRFFVENAVLKLRYNTYNLINEEAIVYLAFAAAGNSLSALTSVSDMQQLWTGVIDDYSINESTLNLRLRQNNFKKNVLIPKTIISTDTFANCPESNVGKPYPIVYGDYTTALADLTHENGIGYSVGSASSAIPSHHYGYTTDFLRAYVVKDTSSMKALISEAVMTNNEQPYYFWNNSRKRFEIFPVNPSTDTPTDNEVVETIAAIFAAANAVFPESLLNQQYYGIVQAVVPFRYATGGSPTNPLNSFDDDPDTYATFSNVNDTIYYYFEDPPGTNIGRYLSVAGQVAYEGGAEDESFQLTLQYTDDDGASWTNYGNNYYLHIAEGTNGQFHYRQPTSGIVSLSITTLSQFRCYIYRRDMATNNGDCRLSSVALNVGYSSGEISILATTGKGIYFGSWIDASGRSNTKDENDLIENPAFVIESIGRDFMGLDSNSLNTSSFDSMFTDLSGWEMAFQLLERTDTNKLIGEIGKQSRTSLYWDESDKLKAIVFDDSDAFPNATTDIDEVPGNLDIFDEDATIVSDAFTTHPILETGQGVTPFEIRHMGMDEVKNDFVLYYKKNNASGEYEKNLYITNGEGTEASVDTNITAAYLENDQDLTKTGNLKQLCADSYNKIGSTKTWEYKAWAVRDEATANKLIQHYIERLTTNRRIVRFTTGINGLAHDVGDFINVRHHRLQDLYGLATMQTKKWEVIRTEINLETFNVTIEAIEV